jgi:hypothetical protein
MLSIRRVLAVAAATAALGIGLPASAGAARMPADCTAYYDTGINTGTMTCTLRPAGQHWHAFIFCAGGGGGQFAIGSSVVGNGSSTGFCMTGRPTYLVFTPE